MLFYWFVVIVSNVPVREAATNRYHLYSVAVPSHRFATPKRKAPLAKHWSEKIDKPAEDNFVYALDIVSDRDPIGWQYYDDSINNRIEGDLSGSETPSNSLTYKRKPQTSLLGVVPPRCRGLSPGKAERCLASYSQKKLARLKESSSFAKGYYDDNWSFDSFINKQSATEDFDDIDESTNGNIFTPRPESDEEFVERSAAKTESAEASAEGHKIKTTSLRSPGDYGNYDSESDEESKSGTEADDVDSIRKVYTEVTGDKHVNKEKIIKFVKTMNEKLRLYNSHPRKKKDYTRSRPHFDLLQQYAFDYIFSNVMQTKRPRQRPSLFYTIQKL